MNLPTEMGSYIAGLSDWTVEDTQFIARFDLRQHFNGSDWVDVSARSLGITGYFYVIKKDGQPNKTTIDNLKASLGWSGRSLAELVQTDWSGVEVQITVGQEEYQGQWRTNVKWINPRDAIPGGGPLKKPEAQEIQSLDAKYGAMLRAMNGAEPAKAPANGAAGKFAPVVNGAADTARKQAWADFRANWDEVVKAKPEEEPHRNDRWKEIVEQLGIIDQAKASAADWKKVSDFVKSISLAPAFSDDEIPF